MRPIKFRAWDNDQMHYQVMAGGFNQTVPSIYVERNGIYEWVNASPGYIVMQYTGIKDRTGQEIYEGDIMGGCYEPMYIGWCDACKSLQLMLSAPGYGPCAQCEGDVPWLDFVQDKIENIIVFANVHQNPEMLK